MRALIWLALFYFGVRYALLPIMPVVVGLGAAALVQKPAALLSSRMPRLSRRCCCLILTSMLLFAVGATAALIICSVFDGAVSFCPGIPGYLESFRNFAREASSSAGGGAWKRFTSFAAAGAVRCLDFLSENYRDYLPSVLGRSTRIVSWLPSFAASVLFAVLSALFACGDFDRVKRTALSLVPEEYRPAVTAAAKSTTRTVGILFRTYGTLMLITFCELAAGLGLMNIAGYSTGNVFSIALVIALIDILPVLGTGTVLLPWSLFEFITGRPVPGTMLLALAAVIEIVRNLLEPKLIAGRLELHPFFTLAGVWIGGRLFGPAGILVTPLAMMIAKDLRSSQKTAAGKTGFTAADE